MYFQIGSRVSLLYAYVCVHICVCVRAYILTFECWRPLWLFTLCSAFCLTEHHPGLCNGTSSRILHSKYFSHRCQWLADDMSPLKWTFRAAWALPLGAPAWQRLGTNVGLMLLWARQLSRVTIRVCWTCLLGCHVQFAHDLLAKKWERSGRMWDWKLILLLWQLHSSRSNAKCNLYLYTLTSCTGRESI